MLCHCRGVFRLMSTANIPWNWGRLGILDFLNWCTFAYKPKVTYIHHITSHYTNYITLHTHLLYIICIPCNSIPFHSVALHYINALITLHQCMHTYMHCIYNTIPYHTIPFHYVLHACTNSIETRTYTHLHSWCALRSKVYIWSACPL